MKKPTLGLICLFALTLLTGCLSPDAAMKSFLGQHSSELVARWGPPQQTMSDGHGGQIWNYPQQRQWTTPGQADTSVSGTSVSHGNIYMNPNGATYSGNSSVSGNATTTYMPPQTHAWTANRSFFVNSDGIIYRYAWRGL